MIAGWFRKRHTTVVPGLVRVEIPGVTARHSSAALLEAAGLEALGNLEVRSAEIGGITHLVRLEPWDDNMASACRKVMLHPERTSDEQTSLRVLRERAMCAACDGHLWERVRAARGHTSSTTAAVELVEVHLRLATSTEIALELGRGRYWEEWMAQATTVAQRELDASLERAVQGPVHVPGSMYTVQGALDVPVWTAEADRTLGARGRAWKAYHNAQQRRQAVALRHDSVMGAWPRETWEVLEDLAEAALTHQEAWASSVEERLHAPRIQHITRLDALERVLGRGVVETLRAAPAPPEGDLGERYGLDASPVLLLRQRGEQDHALGTSHEVARSENLRVHRMPRYAAEVMLGVEGWRGQQIADAVVEGVEVSAEEVRLALDLWAPEQGWPGCVRAACEASR